MHHVRKHLSQRAYSILTQHIKTRPTNLEMVLAEGTSMDNKLVEFYSATYLREDPVIQAAGIKDTTELRKFLGLSLLTQHSVLLKDRASGDVVAAASGGPITYNTENHIRLHAESMKDAQSQRLVNLWASVMSETNLLDRLHVPTIWDLSFIATSPHVRGLGLSRFLLTQQCRLAAKLGYFVLCVESTNNFLSKVLKREGFQETPGRLLSSFLNPLGTPWIPTTIPYPHSEIQVFYRFLNSIKISESRLQ